VPGSLSLTLSRAAFAGIALIAASSCSGASLSSKTTPITGFWQDDRQADYLVGIEDRRYTVSFGGQVRKVSVILSSSRTQIQLCEDGQDSIREFSLDGSHLYLRDPRTSEVHYLRRLSSKPPDLMLLPLDIPEPIPIPAEKARQIEGELSRRVQADQETQKHQFDRLWKSPPVTEQGLGTADLKIIATAAENTAYLKKLVREVGWIDSKRFGATAADDAFLLAQHSQDLPLMLAALPWIKREVDARRLEGETYALLYDRIQLLSGEKQLYGTRVGRDSLGRAIVLPTEEPEKVEVRREALGMTPLSQYVGIFGATEVRFSSACQRPGEVR
jgi:hypothetical protein